MRFSLASAFTAAQPRLTELQSVRASGVDPLARCSQVETVRPAQSFCVERAYRESVAISTQDLGTPRGSTARIRPANFGPEVQRGLGQGLERFGRALQEAELEDFSGEMRSGPRRAPKVDTE